MIISDKFKRFNDNTTGREIIKLTEGDAFCYPMYYFIPTFSKRQKYLIYHRLTNEELQLYRLDMTTGENVKMTNAKYNDTEWYPWTQGTSSGVLDNRSVVNVEKNMVIFMDGNDVRTIDIRSLDDKHLFTIPSDRMAIGQNCVTPDGKWFVYIHHDREQFDRYRYECKNGQIDNYTLRSQSKGTRLDAYNLVTGENRNLVTINSPIHHVLSYDNEHVIFCHLANENAMLLTDIKGGWYKHMRTQDDKGAVCHFLPTKKGVCYEVLGKHSNNNGGNYGGLYNPFNNERFEFPLPMHFGYTHTGWDPDGDIFFYENSNPKEDIHNIYYAREINPNGKDIWERLISDWKCYGDGQKSHFHPTIAPDRDWMLFTADDDETKTNHIYLMSVRDLIPTKGIPKIV